MGPFFAGYYAQREITIAAWARQSENKSVCMQCAGKESVKHINAIWEVVTLMAIGNTMKDKDLLTGVRMVDKVNVRDEGVASRLFCTVLSQLVCVRW